ncbi:hypothetical protein EYC80_009984 [Monilinia laxa]|uniref:Uncharacterized protein n=1 Tax=Monilinia laxa TaxID=61186 RepID=A0A5N6JU46_MONLA|nr:hypothetical protein EYC80_009984 [Monilinia laxa]
MSETISDDDQYRRRCSEFDKEVEKLSEALKKCIELLQTRREPSERRIRALGEFQKRIDDWREEFKNKTAETSDDTILDTSAGGQDQAIMI